MCIDPSEMLGPERQKPQRVEVHIRQIGQTLRPVEIRPFGAQHTGTLSQIEQSRPQSR